MLVLCLSVLATLSPWASAMEPEDKDLASDGEHGQHTVDGGPQTSMQGNGDDSSLVGEDTTGAQMRQETSGDIEDQAPRVVLPLQPTRTGRYGKQ